MDRGPDPPLGVVEQFGGLRPQIGEAPFRGELRESTRAEFVRGHLSSEVPEPLFRVQGLVPESFHDAGLLASAIQELLRLQDEAFLVEPRRVRGHGSRRDAADVGVVGPIRREPEESAAGEDRPDERHIGQVRPAMVGVVQDHLIAFPQRPREIMEDGLDRGRHGTQVDRDVLRLGQHPTGFIEQRATRVHALLDVGRVCAPLQGDAHLLRYEGERRPKDLELRRVHSPTEISRRPNRSTRRRPPGGTIVVAWSSDTTAGPSISVSAPRRPRS